MSDGPRIIHPFDRAPSRDELAANAVRWAQVAKGELPRKVGFIFIFFQREAIGQAKGVTVANVRTEAIKDELKAVVKRFGEQRRIILPGEE